jgi:hypothetical protein
VNRVKKKKKNENLKRGAGIQGMGSRKEKIGEILKTGT